MYKTHTRHLKYYSDNIMILSKKDFYSQRTKKRSHNLLNKRVIHLASYMFILAISIGDTGLFQI